MTTTDTSPAPVLVTDPTPWRPAPQADLPYEQALRTPTRRWWATPLSALVLVASYLAMLTVAMIIIGIAVAVAVPQDVLMRIAADPDALLTPSFTRETAPYMLLGVNLTLAAMIPAVLLANRATSGLPVGLTHSVTGRFRWGWCLRVTLWLIPLWVALVGISALLEPAGTGSLPWASRALLVGVVLLTTPWQCAGEEYLFRGWIMQNVGAYFTSRTLAFGVSAAASITLFVLAHGTADFWLILPIAVMALVACLLTSRTGGLEAAVGVHVVNNVVGMVIAALAGLDGGIITAESVGSPASLIQVGVTLLAAIVVLRLAHLNRVRTTTGRALTASALS